VVNGNLEGNIEETREKLLGYCKRETFAMVKILERLLSV